MAMATLKSKSKLKDYDDYDVVETPKQTVDSNAAKLITKQKDYAPADTVAETEKFTYDKAPAYANKYQSQIDDLMNGVLNREQFTYNPEEDETYLQYKDSYTRNGQRAMQDTLGQVSARTGGLASSYATSASQQAYDNYMSALADKIPELKQLAYAMYQDELNNKRADLNMLMTADQNEYSKYLNELNQYNTDRSFDYGVFADDRNFDYQLSRDELEDSWRDKQWDYQVEQDQYSKDIYGKEWDYNTALQKAQILASVGDYSGYKVLGLTDEQIENMENEYQRQLRASQSKNSSGGTKKTNELTYAQAKELIDNENYAPNAVKVYQDYTGVNPIDEKIKTIADYDEAVNFMEQFDVPSWLTDTLISREYWESGKENYEASGTDYNVDYEANDYEEYLREFLTKALEV